MLFLLTGNYTPQALNAMRDNPNATSRRAAAEQMVTAAGGKLVGLYFTIADGPGVHAIVDVDPIAAAAIIGTVVSSGAFQNPKLARLFTEDEVVAVRQKRAQIHASYKPPGQ